MKTSIKMCNKCGNQMEKVFTIYDTFHLGRMATFFKSTKCYDSRTYARYNCFKCSPDKCNKIMNKDIKLVVRNIIGEPIDGYSRVTVSNEVFNAVRGITPALPYRGQGDLGGNGVRVFSFNGVELCASYDKESRKTMFLMKAEEAKAHLLTLAQERDKAEKLPFNTSLFDRNVVAVA